MTNNNETSELETILRATEAVRSSLSLSQLVPVYDGILKLQQHTETNTETTAAPEIDFTQPPGEILLKLQYRLFHSNLSCIWEKLTLIVVPSIAQTKNDKKSVSVELVNAILDALFLELKETADTSSFHNAMQLLTKSQDEDPLDWNISCRILARVAHHFPLETRNAIGTRICQVMDRPVEALPVVVETLLPLYETPEETVWTAMERCYQTQLIHCSTILCCITIKKHPDWLQDFIFRCLGDSNRLLRRRGIYLLSNIENFQDYATCFEALEMESEPHLLEPVWDAVESLDVPSEWMQLLYRASLDFTQASTRKTNLHRFLIMKRKDVTVEFVTHSLIPAVDSVVASGSIGILFGDSKRTQQRTTLLHLLCSFLNEFLHPRNDWTDFMVDFWRAELFEKTRDSIHRSLVWNDANTVEVTQILLQSVLRGRRYSVAPRKYRETMLDFLATMLSHATKTTAPPKMVLSVLAMFLSETKPPKNSIEDLLKCWLANYPGSVVATAFVDGQLLDGVSSSEQDVRSGYITPTEVELAPAVAYACRLTQQPLWPAVSKGMGNLLRTERMARAVLLIEYGCRYEFISGMGNGSLLMDKKDNMMPPPPNIENLVLSAISFIEATITKLVETIESVRASGRSDEVKTRSETYFRLLSHLEAICKGFPNSLNVDNAMNSIVQQNRVVETVTQLAMLYGAISCGTEVEQPSELVISILNMKMPPKAVNTTRSFFVLAKWGSLSHLISCIDPSVPDNTQLLDSFLEEALEAVDSAPRDVIVPLFRCVLNAGDAQLAAKEKYSASLIKKISDAIFGLLEETVKIADQIYMLDQFCQLLFKPSYLYAEYVKLEKKSTSKAPIRQSFRRMMKMAGNSRPHINRVFLMRACSSWLHAQPEGIGLTAIPYRDDILQLLVEKESALCDEFVETSVDETEKQDPFLSQLAQGVKNNQGGVSKGIILVFLSMLTTREPGVCEKVETDLIQYFLLKGIDLASSKPTGPFVQLGEIVNHVSKGCFEALGSHNAPHALRYFAEIFCIQCSRKFPVLFGNLLVKHIGRTANSNQEIASLLIVAGNLVVGRYQDDFMPEGETPIDVMDLLRASLPWLSSTQSFTRGAAQLLCHALISKIKSADPNIVAECFLVSDVFVFLDQHPEMKRLRSKQQAFFEQYDADATCTPEGLLSLPVDESGETAPSHLVDVLKECFRELYNDVGEDEEKPFWKMFAMEKAAQDALNTPPSNLLESFQRKIIPVDALNLLLEDEKTQSIRNKAGRHKQDLVVCASLIEKVPNLGGLARTCEIFAAQKLVVPDLSVTKMDNFASLSVGAGDWLDIEECGRQDLLSWLSARRKEGYFIVGIEQTSSSSSLSTFEFPLKPTVLLLGEEKQGIPVQLLNMVHQCLEIPQLGIIRSLNVHVSGAIAIWEFTKQRMADRN